MALKILKKAAQFGIYSFAIIGFTLSAGFLAVKFHLTDTSGRIDLNDRYFTQSAAVLRSLSETTDPNIFARNLCLAKMIRKVYPDNGAKILAAYEQSRSEKLLAQMVRAAELYALDNPQYQQEKVSCEDPETASEVLLSSQGESNLYAWINTPEWQTLKEALVKDQETIKRVEGETGVSERLIVAQIVGEQLRLFHDQREVFKQIFQPLKILGNEVKFSLGVAGIKEETAILIEKNLKDRSSVMYLGPEYENLLNFDTPEAAQERFERLTDPHDRYYSYLYTALFLKQIEKQWQAAGFDISDRPEILATIFNLGFSKSVPKAEPQVGGSEIDIAGRTYTFGALAYEFYFSGELMDEFPLK